MTDPGSFDYEELPKRAVWIFCAGPLLLAIVVAIGWTLDIDFFKNPFVGQPPVAPTSALCFLLSSLSIIGISQSPLRHTSKIHQNVMAAAAFVVFSIGTLILVHYLWPHSIDVEQFFCQNTLPQQGGFAPGRMAANTSFCFTLLGLSCLLGGGRGEESRRLVSHCLAVGVAFFAGVAAVGYLYGQPHMYGGGLFTPMALPTALAILSLGCAVLLTQPDIGIVRLLRSPNEGGMVARQLLPATIGIPILLGYLRIVGEQTGLYSPELGMSMMVVVMILLLCLIIIQNAVLIDKVCQEKESHVQTVKVLNTELGEARDKAVEAVRIKSEFLANMSHEIRTPMNAVIGCADMLARTQLNTEQKRFVEIITSSGQALMEIINDILLLSKIEAGKVDIAEAEIDLTALAEKSVAMLAESARKKGLCLTSFVAPDVDSRLLGDPQWIRQVLCNLLSNAVKFTSSGSVTLRVTVDKQPPGAGKPDNAPAVALPVRFEVCDTGIGIAPAVVQKLFQPFTQADGSVTRKFGGTGLGLAISRRLVEHMGGALAVTSEVSVGSTFSFVLPLKRLNDERRNIKKFNFSGTRVLVVGVPKGEFETIKSYCESWDVQTTLCASMDAAVHLAEFERRSGRLFDLILCDGASADLYSFSLSISCFRAPNTRLVLLSEVSELQQAERFNYYGFDGIVSRPLRQSELLDELMKARFPSVESVGKLMSVPGVANCAVDTIPFAKERILLVEDSAINQEVTRLQLEELGFDCKICADGREAINELKQNRYSLVLMDCQMPVMDGFQATAALREMEKTTGMRSIVVAMTANAMKGDAEKCLSAGMDDYISKPVTSDVLKGVLNKWMAAVVSTSRKIRILVAEDNRVMREAAILMLAQCREFEVVGECADGGRLLDMIAEIQPDVAILDIELAGRSGFDVIELIKSQGPDIKAIMLTANDTEEELLEAFASGADGYLLKHDFVNTQLTDAVLSVMSGNCWIDPLLARRLFEAAPFARDSRMSLTADEQSLLEQMSMRANSTNKTGLEVDCSLFSKLQRIHIGLRTKS